MNSPAFLTVDVSRETVDALSEFSNLVRKWTRAVNLVSKSSVDGLWRRHICDSLQLLPLIPAESRSLVDFGSGGGFPAIPLAIAAKGDMRDLRFTMVESDHRKAAFLFTAIREFDLNATVIVERIENLPPSNFDVCTARALAPLDQLLTQAANHLSAKGVALFLKGQSVDSEIEAARENWMFHLERTPSKIDRSGTILEISEIRRVYR